MTLTYDNVVKYSYLLANLLKLEQALDVNEMRND